MRLEVASFVRRVLLVLFFEVKAMVKREILERKEWTAMVGHDQRRIRIYTFGGTQIGLAGVGQGEEALTFPAHWDVQDCLVAPSLHWIRFSTPEEKQETPAGFTPMWWRHLEEEHVPIRFVYSNGTVAEPGMPLGMYGTVVHAVARGRVEDAEDDESKWEAKPLMSLENIDTPPTPPPRLR